MTRGFWLFLSVCALTAGTYALPDANLKWACLLVLVALWLCTPVPSKAVNDEDSQATEGKL